MITDFSSHTVLITGASSGIGRSFAAALAARGAALVLVARRRDRLEELAAGIRSENGVSVEVVAADLTHPDAATALHAELRRRGVGVTGLINNAGFGTWGPFAEEDLAQVEEEIALDVAAPVRLVAAFLPGIRDAGAGFVINVASMAAYQPSPRMAVYAAAKAFVLSFSEALWAELRGSGVTAFALSPGATATEFNAVAGTDDATAGAAMRSPEQVVGTALRHLARRHPGPSVADGFRNRAALVLTRALSRRAVVTTMDRITDPARRRRPSPAAAA